jgi:hypothetical protein
MPATHVTKLGQMQESLSDAARLYRGIPIEKVNMIEQLLMAASDAVNSDRALRVLLPI